MCVLPVVDLLNLDGTVLHLFLWPPVPCLRLTPLVFHDYPVNQQVSLLEPQ